MTEVKTPDDKLIDINNYVPKADYDKLTRESGDSAKKATEDINKLKMALLDPDYLNFLESKKNVKVETSKGSMSFGDLTPEDIDRLSPSRVIALAEKILSPKILESVRGEMGKRVDQVQDTLNNVLLHLEVKEAMSNNADYDDLKGDAEKLLLEAGNNLTIQQALDIARSRKPKEDKAEKPTKQPQGSEKPNRSTPQPSLEKSFKSEKEASRAAWEEVKEKHGLTSDVL